LRSVLEKWAPLQPDEEADLEPQVVIARDAPADLSVLRSLIGGDDSTIAAMLKTFRSGARQLGAELARAAGTANVAAAVDAAHRLKSNAYAIGATRLGDLCASIEQVTVEQGEELNELVRKVRMESLAVEVYLQSQERPARIPPP
jgi:HPt (histidine-containing phosphotransfer) domain-containing protein